MDAQSSTRDNIRAAYKRELEPVLTIGQLQECLVRIPSYISLPLTHSLEQMTKSIWEGGKCIDREELKRRRRTGLRQVASSTNLHDRTVFSNLTIRFQDYVKELQERSFSPEVSLREAEDLFDVLSEIHRERISRR